MAAPLSETENSIPDDPVGVLYRFCHAVEVIPVSWAVKYLLAHTADQKFPLIPNETVPL